MYVSAEYLYIIITVYYKTLRTVLTALNTLVAINRNSMDGYATVLIRNTVP